MILIKVYANWCGHCNAMMPEWNILKKKLSKNVEVVEIEDSEIFKLDDFNKKHRVKVTANGYPTVAKVIKNKVQYYNGPRDYKSMLSWVLESKKKTKRRRVRKNRTQKRKN